LQAYVSSCAYSSSPGAFVKLDLWESQDSPGGIKAFVQSACAGKDQIQGLGDIACWNDTSHNEIQIARGGAYLTVSSSTSGDSPDALKSLVQVAIGRVP
jgi:hypothetical protein